MCAGFKVEGVVLSQVDGDQGNEVENRYCPACIVYINLYVGPFARGASEVRHQVP